MSETQWSSRPHRSAKRTKGPFAGGRYGDQQKPAPEPSERMMLVERHWIVVNGSVVWEGNVYETPNPYERFVDYVRDLSIRDLKHVVKKREMSVYADPKSIDWGEIK